MKLFKHSIYTALLFLSFIGNTQINQGTFVPNVPGRNIPFEGEKCASHYMDEYLIRNNPAYLQMRNQIELHTQQVIYNSSLSRSGGVSRGVVYTIPIVFHVMHSGENIGDSTNISYRQIRSCIDALNRDFRRDTVDGGIASSGPLGVDAEIEFCLARRDPNGNFTTGITRHDMSGIQGYLDSGVYHNPSQWRSDASMKAMVSWNPSQYLNVWVVNKIKSTTNIYAGGGGGTIGYATFPGGSSSRDGVVIRFSAAGNDISGIKGFNLWSATNDNTILTHELGHYFNLYHTFQGGSCATESNCSTQGDRCCDTPPTTVGTGNDCTTPQCGGAENKENYMQYQNGDCNSDFTPNQVSRMRAVLQTGGSRNGLTTNLNCVSPHQYNPTLSQIMYPGDSTCSNSIPAFLLVCNGGSDTLKSFNIKFDIDGGFLYTYNWTGSIAPSVCDTIILPTIVTTTGNHSFNARIDSNNINGTYRDGLSADNSLSTAFYSTDGNPVLVSISTDCHANEISWIIRDSNGIVVESGGSYSLGIQNIFEEACLDSGCYTFVIFDSYGNGMTNQGFCPTAGSYEVIDVLTGLPVAKMVGSSNYGDSAVHTFCLPFNAILNPGFTGCDTVYPGHPVYFTDTSYGAPLITGWNWSFGDGSSSTAQNPSHRYATTGTYNVKLKVTNAPASDSTTNTGCVVVIPTPPGYCDTLDNYDPIVDTLITYNILGSWGYYPGHNGASLSGYAEPFTLTSPSNTIQRFILPVVRAYAGTPSSNFRLNIYADNSGTPGAIIYTDTILISSLVEGVSNEVYLTTPPTMTGNFWAGFEFDYGNGDTLAITTASNRITGVNTTYVKTATIWQSAFAAANIKTSLGLRLIYTDLPITASVGISNTRICQGSSTTFTAISPMNYDSLKWYFPGGTPSTSTNLTQSVSYSVPGRYKAILYLEGICSNDSLIRYINVDAASVSASFTETALSICELDTIKFSGTVSGTGTVQWSFPGGAPLSSSQLNDTVVFNTFGSYPVKLKFQNGCGSDSVTKIIDVKSYPQTIVTPIDTTVCSGELVTLVSSGGLTSTWNTGASTTSLNVTPVVTTNYWVVSKNGVCIGDTAYSVVKINITPVVVANASPLTICLGSSIYFSMTGSNAINYTWDFGDLNTSTNPNVNHTYASAGAYNATLTGVYGVCDNVDNITVVVNDCTGEEEYEFNQSISVYPNPVKNILNVGILDTEIDKLEMKLISSTGQLVYQETIINSNKNVETIDLSKFSEGIYLLKFNTGKNVFTRRLVIVK